MVRRRRRKLCIGCAIVFLTLLTALLVMVILAFTVLKPKNPVMKVESIELDSLSADLSAARINATLAVLLSLKNRNPASLRFNQGTTDIFYRETQVAQASTPPGSLGAGATTDIRTNLTALADRFLKDSSSLVLDLLSGSLPFTSQTRISGRITILALFKRHVDLTAKCDIVVAVVDRSVKDLACTYDISL